MAKALANLMPAVPIIMFTNFADDEFIHREVAASGIKHVVAKSDSSALVQAVELCLGG